MQTDAPAPVGEFAGKQQPTGFVYDPVFLQHVISPHHPESPARLRVLVELADTSGILSRLQRLPVKQNVESHIAELHTEQHIESLRQRHPRSEQAAEAAAGGALAAVEQVCRGRIRNAFCALRPPGHHALNSGEIEGFCLYNNIAIAARYAQKTHGLERILIVDWDYHHGNATEAMFYHDPSVLFFSTHDLHAYPGTGDPNKKGEGDGVGYNINVHLDCGTQDEQIIDVFEQKLLPAAEKFKPELILVSAGFDSRQDDPLGCFSITDQGFIKLTEIVMQLADTHCNGRVVAMLEGGYNIKGNAQGVLAHVSTLMEFQ